MKNRAEADAEGLREKINQLEAELERVKAAGEEDNPVAKVQHTVDSARARSRPALARAPPSSVDQRRRTTRHRPSRRCRNRKRRFPSPDP